MTEELAVRASVLSHDPHASPADLRRAIFLRFDGHEVDGVGRERILARLRAPAVSDR